jgi:hypothetical protein
MIAMKEQRKYGELLGYLESGLRLMGFPKPALSKKGR